MKDTEVTISKKHKLVIENGKLSLDGEILSHLEFVKQEITFKFPNRSTLTITARKLNPGSLLETQIDGNQLNQIKREWENK